MSDEHVIVVAVEDLATAGAVAAAAVRLALKQDATTLYLVHVLDQHPVLNGMLGMTGAYAPPVLETGDDARTMLDVAERVIRAEFAALGKPAPSIQQEVAEGHAGEAVARLAAEHQAGWIVLGARRPHLFGRLTHPDMRAHLAGHTSCQVHVAPLHEVAPEPST